MAMAPVMTAQPVMGPAPANLAMMRPVTAPRHSLVLMKKVVIAFLIIMALIATLAPASPVDLPPVMAMAAVMTALAVMAPVSVMNIISKKTIALLAYYLMVLIRKRGAKIVYLTIMASCAKNVLGKPQAANFALAMAIAMMA